MNCGVRGTGGNEFVSANATTDPKSKLTKIVFMTEIPVEQGRPVPDALALGTLRVCRPEFQMSKVQFRRKSGRAVRQQSEEEEEKEEPAGDANAKITAATGGRTNWF